MILEKEKAFLKREWKKNPLLLIVKVLFAFEVLVLIVSMILVLVSTLVNFVLGY